jgi:molecular chaperone DnaJ
VSAQDYVEKDYYKTLGVTKDSDAATIKKSYRKLARELHPDKNPNNAAAEARFKEVSEAYDVLSDDSKRKEYDEARSLFGSGGFRPAGGYGGGGFSPGGSSSFDMSDLFRGTASNGANIGDMFSDLFGSGASGRRGPAPERGADLSAEIRLGFDEAVRGESIPLQLSGPAACKTCHGSGAAPGAGVHRCPTCGGSGQVIRNQGGFGFSEPCRDCRGTGQVPDEICPECRGSGTTNQTRTITVRVPAGVRDGARLRIPGKGAPGQRGGAAGDLFVTVRVDAHPLFGRNGEDLILTVPITYAEAALGTTLRVPTLNGAVSLKVAPGTPSGRTLRVRGRGVAAAKRTGDLLVTVEVAVPQRLSGEAKAALEGYAAAQHDDPRPEITAALQGGSEHG